MSDTKNRTDVKEKPRRPTRRVVLLILGGLLLIAVVYGGSKYRQWRSEPGYWADNGKMLAAIPQDEKRQRSDALIGRLGQEWSAFGAADTQALIESPDAAEQVLGDERTIVIPFEDLNIMLEVEAPAMLASQGAPLPDAIKGMMVTSDGGGRLIVAFEYDGPEVHQVFSVTLALSATAEGIITSTLVSARGGEMSLPRDRALRALADIVGGDRAVGEIKLMKLFTGEPFGPMDVPIDPGDDGVRNGRITGIEVRDEAIHITRTTVPRRPRRDRRAE